MKYSRITAETTESLIFTGKILFTFAYSIVTSFLRRKNLNIVVLAGGLSPERNVSLSSGSLISEALRRKGHNVLLLDVYLGIELEGDKDPLSLFTTEKGEEFTVSSTVPDLDALKAKRGGEELIGKNVIKLCEVADVVFLALHGGMGENGQLQATLDNFGISYYTGSGYTGSLLAMDKDISKSLLSCAGVDTPEWIYMSADELSPKLIEDKVGIPCVIKPCSCGSSVGITIAEDRASLAKSLAEAAKYEKFLVVEKKIEGREFTMAILDGKTLPPVEIIPKCGFYDYKNKYQQGATVELCPAPISAEDEKRMSDITKKGFAALRLCDYARFDYIMDKDGKIFCLEANTLPGMTPTSLMPQEAAAIGISYDELCDKIASLAYAKKTKIKDN